MLSDATVTTMLPVKNLDRARRFYERHGWAASGISAAFDQYCAVSVPEIEYRKQLRGAS